VNPKLDMEEINKQFEAANKPVRIIGDYKAVYSFALFKCENGHEFMDIAGNVIRRKSTDVTKYCLQCRDSKVGIKRHIKATYFPKYDQDTTLRLGFDNGYGAGLDVIKTAIDHGGFYEAWYKKGQGFVTVHRSDTKKELLDWCIAQGYEQPTWTRDNDRFDDYKLKLIIQHYPDKIGTQWEWRVSKVKGNDIIPQFYTPREQYAINYVTISNTVNGY